METLVKHAPLDLQLKVSSYGTKKSLFHHYYSITTSHNQGSGRYAVATTLLRPPRHDPSATRSTMRALLSGESAFHVGRLPGDFWTEIMTYLEPREHLAAESTCRDMLSMGHAADAWCPDIRLSPHAPTLTDYVLTSRLACLKMTKEVKEDETETYTLELRGCGHLTDASLACLFRISLSSLNLSFCHSLSENCLAGLQVPPPPQIQISHL